MWALSSELNSIQNLVFELQGSVAVEDQNLVVFTVNFVLLFDIILQMVDTSNNNTNILPN